MMKTPRPHSVSSWYRLHGERCRWPSSGGALRWGLPREGLGECGLRFRAAVPLVSAGLVPCDDGVPSAMGLQAVFRMGEWCGGVGRRTTSRQDGSWLREGAGRICCQGARDGMSPSGLAAHQAPCFLAEITDDDETSVPPWKSGSSAPKPEACPSKVKPYF